MTTGQRIKAARKATGMTQKELGDKLGLSFQSIAQWENDLRNPKYETLERLADALDIPVEVLLGIGDSIGPVRTDRAQQPPNEIIFNATPDPEWVDLETKLKNGTITPEKLQRYKDLNTIMAGNTHRAVEDAKLRLQKIMKQLNDAGLQKVVERAEELTEIPRYRAETVPQSLFPTSRGTAAPPPDAPETPENGG